MCVFWLQRKKKRIRRMFFLKSNSKMAAAAVRGRGEKTQERKNMYTHKT